MEEIPVISVIEGTEGVGLSEEGLAFTMNEDNELNYAYIIQLPGDGEDGSILTQEALLGHATFLIDNKHTTLSNFELSQEVVEVGRVSESTETITDSGVVVTTSSVGTTVQTFSESTDNGWTGGDLQPIQLQYVQSDGDGGGGGGVVLDEEQKCAVANLLEFHNQPPTNVTDADIKHDPSSDGSVTVNTSELGELEVGELRYFQTLDGIIPDKTVEETENSFVNVNEQSCSTTPNASQKNHIHIAADSRDYITETQTKPVRTIKTYGKTKPKSEGPTPSASREVKNGATSRLPTTVLQHGAVTVSKSKPVTLAGHIKKRRLVIDTQKQIPISEFKKQLQNTKDILQGKGNIAPPTRQAMKCLEFGGVAKFFSSPGRNIRNVPLSRLFSNNLVMVAESENASARADSIVPLNADLEIPSSSDSMYHEYDESNGKTWLPTNISKAKQNKRIVNIGKPGGCSVESMFKGLNRPPVFKEYARVRRKPKQALNSNILLNKQSTKIASKDMSLDIQSHGAELVTSVSPSPVQITPSQPEEEEPICTQQSEQTPLPDVGSGHMLGANSENVENDQKPVLEVFPEMKAELILGDVNDEDDLDQPSTDQNFGDSSEDVGQFTVPDCLDESRVLIVGSSADTYELHAEDLKLWTEVSPS